MYVKIDCSLFEDKKQMHEIIRNELQIKDYIGNNLDALYDVLTSISSKTSISFYNLSSANKVLGTYFDNFIKALFDAAETNKNLILTFSY